MELTADSESRRTEIESLLEEAEQISSDLATWQTPTTPSSSTLLENRKKYHSWYARAKRVVPAEDLPKFIDMYEGGDFIKRIKAFLSSPLEKNQFYNASESNSFIPEWSHPYETTFAQSFAE
ncbi:hypothetical protein K7472_27315 [Streptomyces sp. PTM05]|uniref:Uncharacterized protein n=1 Tax=Streptantibioticus parmotrematis TaxID=2873249 RepID=A0ABS7QZ79_9ACTN|nr:hypothetical protein [Streptantibioticus parmotrematis]MBY8888523.1 hypothetical protein [Streptantibioticus parmotrematis]